jgi:quercetin dioxygenase-like cupin family protein
MVEIHDVIAGCGTCTLESSAIPYAPGMVGVMPADRVHRVEAGEDGQFLLATFSPPLV